MRVVAALDSFKGSLGSRSAGDAVRVGVLRALPHAEVAVVAVADGGEGTLEAVSERVTARVEVDTVDALGRPVRAPYVVTEDGSAVVESALTVGLGTVGQVDATVPPRASSYGVGLQVAHALAHTGGRVLVGLGGTACTDGGTGLLQALGVEIRTGSAGGNPLWQLESLDSGVPDLSRVVALSDVTNPLLGELGAARVFGPQKGATPDQVERLERRMSLWATSLVEIGRDVARAPGAGAAGGMGAALLACGARLSPGFGVLAELSGLTAMVEGADLVVTGEGSVDRQTAMGKAPAGVAALARSAGALVVALGGRVERPADEVFDAVFPIHGRPRADAEALDPAVTAEELAATAAEVVRLVARGREGGAAPE